MSEPDSSQRRRPPTIDLTAKEVETEPAGAAQDSAAADRPAAGAAPSRSRIGPYVIGVVAGVIAAGAVAAGLWTSGFLPSQGMPAQSIAPAPQPVAPTTPQSVAPTAANPAATDEISSRLDKIQQALQTPRSDDAMSARVTEAAAQTKALNDAVAALTHRVDDLAATAQNALTEAKAAVATAGAAKNAAQAAAQHGDIDALAKRVAALEGAVKSLAADLARRPSTTDDKAARATLAAEALRAAVERGASYEVELAAVQPLGADPSAIAALAPYAADGVPSAATLGRELAALAPSLRQASAVTPRNGSLLGRLEASAQKLVRVTPVDAPGAQMPTGDDTASVIDRINADAEHNDIAAALGDVARLPDAARAPAQAWVKKAEAREAAIAASRRIATDALAALKKPAAQ